MYYKSTRKIGHKISSKEAIIKGLSYDGGLLFAEKIPKLSLKSLSYQDFAFGVLKVFFDDFSDGELIHAIENAYDEKFDDERITPLIKTKDAFILELFHGKTSAFKDLALSILPYLMTIAKGSLNIRKKIAILTATSGDTGKAALEGFKNVDGTEVFVFYPADGISEIQKKQMITQDGENVHIFGINGNFDDAQNAVKKIFEDKDFNKKMSENGYILSSANSINIGRLFPQIIYYFYAYNLLLEEREIVNGEKINITVPTGNFGNILAAYIAKKMSLPIDKLIIASNKNKILTDFFNTGTYDTNREFFITNSPSMDILISSNLERLLYFLFDEKMVKKSMDLLKRTGKFEIPKEIAKEKFIDFYANFSDEDRTLKTIKKVYKENNYLIDTHTAVGYSVYLDYKEKTKDKKKTIIAGTASPYKFPQAISYALGISDGNEDDYTLLRKIHEKTSVKIPDNLKNLDKKKIRHGRIIEKEEIKAVILSE